LPFKVKPKLCEVASLTTPLACTLLAASVYTVWQLPLLVECTVTVVSVLEVPLSVVSVFQVCMGDVVLLLSTLPVNLELTFTELG